MSQAPDDKPDSTVDLTAPGKRRILYVDDERENLDAFWRRFRRHYDVIRAESAQEAMRLLEQYDDIPLLITDQRMPGMTGVQLLEKAASKWPEQVRIVLTGYTDIEALIDAINTGHIFRYVQKPWDEAEMHLTLKNAIESFDLRSENRQLLSRLKVHNEELERRVHERTQELEQLNKTLEQRVVDAVGEAEKLRHLERYISTPLARQLMEAGRFDLGVRRKNMTVMFTDIRGFTSAGETMEPEELVELLNEYLTEMITIVFEEGGTLDKFIGDAIMVFYGDPVDMPDHAERAVRTALRMQRRMVELQEKWFKRGERPWGIGIGINTGYMTVGNIGGDRHMDYTVIGNQVNLAARLEHRARPGEILLSHRAYGAVRGRFEVEEVGTVEVKGFTQPVAVYKVIGEKTT